MISKKIIFLLIVTISNVSYAESICDDLWFVRNSIFNDAGYCFKSNLGISVFGNEDCSAEEFSLSSQDQEKVNYIRHLEIEHGTSSMSEECDIDTSRSDLDIHSLELRKRVTEQPFRDDTESTCILYEGPILPLYAARSEEAEILGYVRPGHHLNNSHIGYGNSHIGDEWLFISLVRAKDRETTLPDIGWAKVDFNDCLTVAG